MALTTGQDAPGFTLPGIERGERGEFSLESYRGRPVVLIFYPGDNTVVCTRQLNAYTEDIDTFGEVDAQVLALSPQSVESHEGFAEAQGGFAFPLLADADKEVGESYGVLGPLGFYRRSAFVIDPAGTIAYAHRAIAGLTFRPTAELVAAVRDARR